MIQSGRAICAADRGKTSLPPFARKFRYAINGHAVPAFPLASARPQLPPSLPDELLDFYAFVFCQGGFHQLGMTFEQFLLVVATILPGGLRHTSEDRV